MKGLPREVNGLDALLTAVVSTQQTSTSVSQIGKSAINFVNLTNNSDIEVNLLESDQKDILIAPAIDEDAQKEAAHDSGASSTLIGFRDVFCDYKKQVIPIRTAGNTKIMPLGYDESEFCKKFSAFQICRINYYQFPKFVTN
jgi:hypothetical protein